MESEFHSRMLQIPEWDVPVRGFPVPWYRNWPWKKWHRRKSRNWSQKFLMTKKSQNRSQKFWYRKEYRNRTQIFSEYWCWFGSHSWNFCNLFMVSESVSKNLVPKNVSESVSKNFGTRKCPWTGLEKNLVLESVSFRFWVSSHTDRYPFRIWSVLKTLKTFVHTWIFLQPSKVDFEQCNLF